MARTADPICLLPCMDFTTSVLPKGFWLGDDPSVLYYRTSGRLRTTVGLSIWILWFSFAAAILVYHAAFDALDENSVYVRVAAAFMLLLVGSCAIGIAWEFWSLTRLWIAGDLLVFERSLWRYRKRRIVNQHAIRAVEQVQWFTADGYPDNPRSWDLVVVGEEKVVVLYRQNIDKSDWLGPIIAAWAGVPFERSTNAKTKL